MADREKLVKELFEDTGYYLTYDYNLRIRKENVEEFIAGMKFNSVLDMPCGNGQISLPLLAQFNELTLMDVSGNMIALAKKNTPGEDQVKVKIIHADFFETELPAYDLVISLGLLAHVSSPEKLLRKLATHLRPGGYFILQNTDSTHFYSHLIRFYLGVKNMIKRQTYKLNKVPAALVEKTLQNEGLTLLKTFRYNQSFLGFSNLFSNEKKYKLTRRFFGTVTQPAHQKWGSDFTYFFQKKK